MAADIRKGGFMKLKVCLCALLAAIAISAAGCSESETSEGTTSTSGGEFPSEIEIFAPFSSAIAQFGDDYNAVYGFQLLEEKTGCKINWIHPASANDATEEQFSLMISSGELPDAIVYPWPTVSGGAQKYVDNGFIIDLTDKMEANMPNLMSFLNERPDIKKDCVTDEGKFLYLPYIRKDDELKVYLGPQIRTDWLDKLGIKAPETTDELYDVLVKFKNEDPNGNGEADEIPMIAASFTDTNFGIGNLLWPFGIHYDFYVEDGKVKHGIMEPEFEEGMEYIIRLYSEGLIDQDYILMDRTKMEAKMTSDQAGFMYGFQPTKIMGMMEGKDDQFSLQGIKHLAGPTGERKSFEPNYGSNVFDTVCLAITKENKDPEATLRWMDYIYSEEGTMIMNYAKQGVTYNMVDGEPILPALLLNNPDGLDKTAAFNRYIAAFPSNFPMFQEWGYYEQFLSDAGKAAVKTWISDVDISGIMPKVSLTSDEQKIVTKDMAQINTLVEETYNKLVIGSESLDNIDAIRNELNNMGMQEVLKAYQAAYDRYQAR